jgi:tetratricopeptide (TPR) repeat protein
MRKIGFFIFIVNVLFLVGCSSLKRSASTNEIVLPEREQMDYDYSFTEAQKQVLLGNYSEAKNIYFHCLEIKPKSSAVLYQLGNIYLTSGKQDMALSFARLAFRYDSQNEWYLLLLAQLYQNKNDLDSTLYIYKKLVSLRPQKFEYEFNLALLYFQCNKLDKSLEVLEKLEKEQGPSSEIAVTRYKIYYLKKDNKNCIKVLEDAIQKFPNQSKFIGLLGEYYASLKQDDLALKYFNQLLAVDPDNEKGYLSLIDFYRNTKQPSVALQIAHDFINNKGFSMNSKVEIVSSYLSDRNNFSKYSADMKVMLDSLTSADNENLKVHALRADYYEKTNDLVKALTELQFILSKDNKNAMVWEQILLVYSSVNDYKGILSRVDEPISLFQTNPVFYLYKGIACFQLKKHADAIVTLRIGLKYAIGSNELLEKYFTFLGESYHAVKDYPKADSCFEKALKIDPKNIFVLNNYSYYLSLRNEKLDHALSYSKRCIELEPGNSTFLDTYGWVLFKAGKLLEAKRIMEEALGKGGLRNAEILEHYGEILVSLNQKEDALKFYKMIKGLGRESDRLKELLNLQE